MRGCTEFTLTAFNCLDLFNYMFIKNIKFNCRWQQSLTMEVILSAAFGIDSEAQTNPDDKVTKYAHIAMNPKPYINIALMIPLIGKKLAKSMVLTSWGFNWYPLMDIAKSIIKSRKESEGSKRVVRLTYSILCNLYTFRQLRL